MNPYIQAGRSCTRHGQARKIFAAAALSLATVLAAGCGGSSVSTSTGLPAAPTATTTNTYSGTQSPGLWSLTLDDAADTFSYQASIYATTAVSGATASENGFLKLTPSSGSSAGYAVEYPSRAFLLRPGDDTNWLVGGVQQTSCYPISGNAEFNFIYLVPPYDYDKVIPSSLADITNPYGSIVASTSSDGATWNFTGYSGGYVSRGDPALFSGSCTASNGQAQISVAANGTVVPTAMTISVNQAGFIYIDHSTAKPTWQTEPSQIGVLEPSSATSTSSVLAGDYVGFFSEPGYSNDASGPVYFSPTSTSSSNSSLTGGLYPSDDITQTPNTDMVITLGAESTTQYGLYKTATITRPDPAGHCSSNSEGATSGLDANGNATCTFRAYAVVGKSTDGKYSIFVIGYDFTPIYSATATQGALGIYLFQK